MKEIKAIATIHAVMEKVEEEMVIQDDGSLNPFNPQPAITLYSLVFEVNDETGDAEIDMITNLPEDKKLEAFTLLLAHLESLKDSRLAGIRSGIAARLAAII